ncbi:TonB-dependent siderophore receptor [Achromobacter pulmonis]|uniref:TonB-dependent outer membrane receptor n=2 Tax=Alcaligenaceae TaxID=506 RepID=A9IA95_BORPD|nr:MULTISPECIES: TonB-dependent receptor [Alcaligenaceae]PND33706.1 TonB-dependent siderophore receptor [Achromobacter pulmonis]CAP44559.1 TonB-dependent outer membrane receptor [Bordetella petrii]
MHAPRHYSFTLPSALTVALVACWGSYAHAQSTGQQPANTASEPESVNAIGASQVSGPVRTLPAVTVTGAPESLRSDLMPVYAGGQVARGGSLGLLGNRDVMDTPFSLTSYTAQAMQDQQARSINDVVKNDASVRTIWSDSSYGSQFMIRGFPVQGQDMAVNGLYGIIPPQFSGGVELFERVEVLRGPTALLNGMAPTGAVGGTINLVTKRATDTPIAQVTGSYASDSQFSGHIDLARRLGERNQVGIRFNGLYRDGDTTVDKQGQRLALAGLGLDYRGERVRLSADLGYQNLKSDNPGRPIYLDSGNFDVPRAPKGSSNLGQSWYNAKSEDTFGMVRGEVDLTPNLTAYAAAGGRKNRFLGLYDFIYLQNEDGDFRGRQYYQPTYADTWTAQGGLTGKLKTGPLNHTLDLSFTTLDIESGVLAQVPADYSGSNLYDPISVPKPSLDAFSSHAPKTAHSKLSSVALADTITMLDERVQLTAGVRRQSVKVDNYSAVTGAKTTSYDEHAYSPSVALLVKPWQHVSFYGNYIQGLSQGPSAPAAATNAGTVFAPIKTKQYEIGAKAEFDGFGATIAYFQIKQPSGFLDGSNTYVMDGEQRNRGVEINAFGEVARGVRLLGGVSFIDGELAKTQGGTNDGNKAIGVPDTMLNLGVEWDLPYVSGLTVSARYLYTDSQYVNAANTQEIPSWNRVDVGLRYKTRLLDRNVTLRANVENLFNKDYWAGATSNFGLARGVSRTFLLSATVDF